MENSKIELTHIIVITILNIHKKFNFIKIVYQSNLRYK